MAQPQRFALSEVILGGQDGLVNVLGVILGVAAAGADHNVIIAGGLAATFAESVSMAAVAYTSTTADQDYYEAQKRKERRDIVLDPAGEIQDIRTIFEAEGFRGSQLESIIKTITHNKKAWVDVMMSEELHLQPVSKKSSLRSAFIVGMSALVGSFVPLVPFFLFPAAISMPIAIGISAVTLFVLGAYKAHITVGKWYKSGAQIAIIGMVSAMIGFVIGTLFNVSSAI